MAAIMVDYENVKGNDGLRGVEALNQDDRITIFYSENCSEIRRKEIEAIWASGCRFYIRKLVTVRKNALDFYIATECGMIAAQGETEIAIITGDKGLAAVGEYFKSSGNTEVHVVKAAHIEEALAKLSGDNESRWDSITLTNRMVNLEEEYFGHVGSLTA